MEVKSRYGLSTTYELSIRTDGDKSYIDEDLRERLEAKLIAKTLEFETA